jgi:hypothetical protein
MPRRRSAAFVLLIVALLGSACSSSGGGGGGEQAGPCKPREGERPAKAILRCHDESVAFVETELSSGTGVVIEYGGKRHVLTNAHVVAPFDAADLTIDGRTIEDTPVLGVDVAADIAVLGPIDTDAPALDIADGDDLERGDDVFLVGFPGEASGDDLETTIASGIVSRVRHLEEFDQTYIQTDAAISGGQSGGPLFGSGGDFIGISGLSFAEDKFALALTGADVRKAVSRIAKGDGDEYLDVPPNATDDEGEGEKTGTLKFVDAADGQVLFLPASEKDRIWTFSVATEHRPLVIITPNSGDEPLAISKDADAVNDRVSVELATRFGGKPEDYSNGPSGASAEVLAREVAPGRFEMPVDADQSALVVVFMPLTDTPVTVDWTSDQPLFPLSAPVTEQRVKLGTTRDLLFSGFDTSVDLLVDLEAGQKIEINARSPQGDPAYEVVAPGIVLDHLTAALPDQAGIEYVEDTDDGLYGYDAKDTYTAKTAGTYRIRVYSNDGTPSLVRVTFTHCDPSCKA